MIKEIKENILKKKLSLLGTSIFSATITSLFLKNVSELESGIFFEKDLGFVFVFITIIVFGLLLLGEKY